MKELVYPKEHTLGAITLILGLIAWLALILGTFGGALLWLLIGFIFYLFAQSAFISHIKGNGVELSEEQLPDLYRQYQACCERLKIKKPPKAYVMNGNGGLNAFATKFLGAQYVVLLSDVVDAMSQHEDGVRFYIGHELGHIRMKHLSGHLLRWPVLWLPLLGAAYSRARESTCDRHGLACSSSPENAARALAALAAGSERWRTVDVNVFGDQASLSSGFWMSFHELNSGYPWLTKRVARVLNPSVPMPGRNGFAYLFAMFVPFAGRLGAGFGFIILIYIIAVMAAIAIPAYQDYTVKAKVASAVVGSERIRANLGSYFESNKEPPETLGAVGVNPPQLADGSQLSLDPETMELTVTIKEGSVIFTPKVDPQGHITWACATSDEIKRSQVPANCK